MYKRDGAGLDTKSLAASKVDPSGPVDWSAADKEGGRKSFALNIRIMEREWIFSIFS